ncbi:MAG: transglutaminase [Ruminococcus sp.]|nr:transglutaminase [Ruminococcus sp.]
MRARFVTIAFMAILLCSCSNGNEIREYDAPDSNNASSQIDTTSNSESSDVTSSDTEKETEKESSDNKLYDVTPISDAYHNGDTSNLSDFDLTIYNKACEVLDEIISEDMSDYDKELAVHDWLVENCTYDSGAMSAIPHPSENCDNPYGALINGEAICSGYTTTFRMLMQMLDIPCGTVHAADTEGDEHAWNTVEIDGSWYYVDCTWDDPVPDEDGRLERHLYFNISLDEISQRHIMPNGVPTTDSNEYSYTSQNAVEIDELSQIDEAIKRAIEQNDDSVVLIPNESFGIDLSSTDELDDSFSFSGEFEDALIEALEENECSYIRTIRRETNKGNALYVIFELE